MLQGHAQLFSNTETGQIECYRDMLNFFQTHYMLTFNLTYILFIVEKIRVHFLYHVGNTFITAITFQPFKYRYVHWLKGVILIVYLEY